LTPKDVTVGSNKKVWWLGKCGHEWLTKIADRSKGRNCPYCASQKVLVGYNDLATKNPKLAKEWHPTKNGKLKPIDVLPNSNKKVWWLGKCGHEWEATISSRQGGRDCPYCAGQKVMVGFNDLQTLNSQLAKQWHPTKNGLLTPSDVMPNSNKKAWWLGECGHEWEAVVSSRNRGNGCPYCASQKLLVGFNDLATLNPELAKQWHPTKNGDKKPSDFTPGANKKAWWICEKGHEWEALISSRNKGHGCQECYRIKQKNKV
jgi:DNA-directed RNA polymerase subunit RPC12/RpoP